MAKIIKIEESKDFGIPTCKNCRHFINETLKGETSSFCYRYPPVILICEEDPWMLRPSIEGDDIACGEFKPLN